MKENDTNAIREALGDFLGILQYKTLNGDLTHDEVQVMFSAIEEAGGVKATVKDLAGYYGQSEDNIRHVINRNRMPAPERMVRHDFSAFRRFVPKGWRRKGSKSSR